MKLTGYGCWINSGYECFDIVDREWVEQFDCEMESEYWNIVYLYSVLINSHCFCSFFFFSHYINAIFENLVSYNWLEDSPCLMQISVISLYWRMDPRSYWTNIYQSKLQVYWISSELHDEWASRYRISILEMEATWVWCSSIQCQEISGWYAKQMFGTNWRLNFSQPCTVIALSPFQGKL